MKTRYILEFQLIPKLVGLFNSRKIELFKVVEPEVWGELLRKSGMTDFSHRGYSKSFFRDDHGRFYVLITCPEPQLPTQVKYMVFVIKGACSLNMNRCEGSMEYFTLEKSLGFYAVCSPGEGVHSNCGSMEGEPSAEDFLRNISSGHRLSPVDTCHIPTNNRSSRNRMWLLLIFLAISLTIAAITML